MAGWLDRGRGERAAEVRLVHLDNPKPCGHGVLTQPAQRQLVTDGEDDQGVGGRMPAPGQLRVDDSEIECRVRRLTSLRPGGQIGAGNQTEATE